MQKLGIPLSLTTDGSLRIFFLGTGGAFSKKLFQTNILLIKNDDHLLVDCGSQCSRALVQAGLSITDIRNIVPTHSHADHIGGLEEMALMNRYVLRSKPTMYIPNRYQKILWNQSLRGGSEMSEVHEGKGLEFTDFWNVLRPTRRPRLPNGAQHFSVGTIDVTTFRTRHYPEQATSWKEAMYSIGWIVDDRVFFSGDTQFDPDLVLDLDNRFHFEVLFHDVQFFTGGIHASLDEISQFPAHIKERMYLTHYGENFRQFEQTVRNEGFAGFIHQQTLYQI